MVIRSLRFGGLFVWMCIGLAPAALARLVDKDSAKLHAALGRALARFCEASGPATTKLAQLAASRRDLLPLEFCDALARVQDQARPPSLAAMQSVLTGAYGPVAEWPFQPVSWTPIAAGSIAAVLHAKGRDGQDIAVKLLRSGIRGKIGSDLKLLAKGARLVMRLKRFSHWPLDEGLEQLRAPILGQCDMLAEAAAMAEIARFLPPGVDTPDVRHDLCRSEVLVMSYCRSDFQLTDARLPRLRYEAASRALLGALYRMIFVEGFVHCDLHPGNVGCRLDGTVVLYDFGICARISERERLNLIDLFGAVVDDNCQRAAWAMIDSGRCENGRPDIAVLSLDMQTIIERWSGRQSGSFLVAEFVRDLFDVQKRNGITGAPGFVAAILALVTFEGLVRHGYPDLDFQDLARPYFTSGLLSVITIR